MEATITKLNDFLTPEKAGKLVKHIGSIVIMALSEKGYEIKDMRTYKQRLLDPITNRGILYTLGGNHFIVNAKKMSRIREQFNVVDFREEK